MSANNKHQTTAHKYCKESSKLRYHIRRVVQVKSALVMKCLMKEVVQPTDIHGRLQAQDGEETLSRSKKFS